MKLFRSVVNSGLRGGGGVMTRMDAATQRRMLMAVSGLLSRFRLPLPENINEPWVLDCMELVAEAVTTTPYGQPLAFPEPLVMSVAAASSCPFACANCYANSTPEDATVGMVIEQDVFERVAKARTPFIIVTGGEPLASPTIETDLRRLLEAGKYLYLSTNATVRPIRKLIAECPTRLTIILPVWGNRSRQDELRGSGSQARLEANLEMLARLNATAILLAVISEPDLSLFDNVAELAGGGGVRNVTITRRIRSGRLDNSRKLWDEQMRSSVLEAATSLRKRGLTVDLDIPELRRQQESASASRLRALLGIPVQTQCSAGNWAMHVDSGGRAYPCFAFESDDATAVEAMPVAEQWTRVRSWRSAQVGEFDCLNEATRAG